MEKQKEPEKLNKERRREMEMARKMRLMRR